MGLYLGRIWLDGSRNLHNFCAGSSFQVCLCAAAPVKGPLEQGRKIYIAECTDRCVLEVHFIGDAQFVLGELE